MGLTVCEENEISYKVRNAIFKVYNAIGPGLLEKVYVAALEYEFRKEGLRVRTEFPIPVL
jgi:GxxExxY protein